MLLEVADPDAQCARCPRREKIARYPEEFRRKVGQLVDLWDWVQVGYRIGNDDLRPEEWRALARIRQYFDTKREVQMIGLFGGKQWR